MENKHSVYEILDLNSEEKEWFQVQEKVSNLLVDIISRRIDLNMSQRDLAKKCGIKQPMIARIERFDATPRIDTLIKMCDALGLQIKIVEADNNDNKKIYASRLTNHVDSERYQKQHLLNEKQTLLKRDYSTKLIDESKITEEELSQELKKSYLDVMNGGKTYTVNESAEKINKKNK